MNADDLIELAPFNPSWARAFADEAATLTSLLAPYGLVTVEHIGSTAILGMDAKPIIDLMAGFRALGDREAAVALLGARGYRHWHEDPTRTERCFFVKGLPPDAARRSHTSTPCSMTVTGGASTSSSVIVCAPRRRFRRSTSGSSVRSRPGSVTTARRTRRARPSSSSAS